MAQTSTFASTAALIESTPLALLGVSDERGTGSGKVG